jgi:hypothetical protein
VETGKSLLTTETLVALCLHVKEFYVLALIEIAEAFG